MTRTLSSWLVLLTGCVCWCFLVRDFGRGAESNRLIFDWTAAVSCGYLGYRLR